jgi:hypothetical protein
VAIATIHHAERTQQYCISIFKRKWQLVDWLGQFLRPWLFIYM